MNIILSGIGGQGVVTAGIIISEASSAAGVEVVMSEIHGMSQRGGSVMVEVRTGNVRSPVVPNGKADLILGIEEIEGIRVIGKARRDALVLINRETRSPVYLGIRRSEYPEESELLKIGQNFSRLQFVDAYEMARKAGDGKAAGTALIGYAIAERALPFGRSEAEHALKIVLPSKALQTNINALHMGTEASNGTKTLVS